MGRTLGRLLMCLPPALAAGLFFLGDSTSGIEPDAGVQLASADVPPAPDARDVLPEGHDWTADGPKYVGASGCAAANCHGGDALNGVQGSEHSIWLQKDPHANAYAVLLNQQSKDIIKLLRGSSRYKDLLANREAHETKLCLDCHSVAPQESQLAHGHKFSLRDGVSCEGCHGPAEKWLDEHKRYDWQFKSPEEKALLGFVNTDKLASRARMCAECHIGSENKEVNHDLMAAGHPRLTFEMSAYFDNLPTHWNPNQDRRRNALSNQDQAPADIRSTFDAKLWAIGQMAVGEKTAELLEKRATDPHKVWPEFTEYGCFACHHNLQPSNWRQERGFANRRPGGYPWGTWQFPVLAQASPLLLAGQPNPFLDDNGTYKKLQMEMSRPLPNKEKVAELAGELKTQLKNLGDKVEGMSFSESEIQSLLHAMAGPDGGQKLTGQNWDSAAQVYLATVALYQGLVDAQGRINQPPSDADKAVYDHFREIRENLKFPSVMTDSGKPAIYNSPKTFEETAPHPVEAIKRQLDGINQAVKP
jgi:hypothetical protein